MKKRLLFSLLGLLVGLAGQAASLKFTAVTANVDGLPPVVHINYTVGSRDVEMNEDGSQEPGATRMGQLFAENLWDIVALSEDFNYHNYIMNGVSTYYNATTWRGLIDQSNLHGSLLNYPSATPTDNKGLYMQTDGLCFLTRKKYQVTPVAKDEREGNNWIPWNDHYGFTDNEADGLIRKGFRFYQVTLAEGYVVDVYITHMEAGSDPEDNAARAKQLIQFADYIKSHKGTNPIIILGDTNCRYTRDPLKAGFIDLIEQDTDLHVQDPWVVIRRNGTYPEPNSPSIMVSQYGEQDGEVVDKIWYINNDLSDCTLTCTGYLHDDSFTYADGSQIADHYPVVGTFVIEGPTDIVKPGFEYPEPTGTKEAVVSGRTYFLRNVGSGEFLRAGGKWTTQAVMGDYSSKIIPTSKGGGKYSLKTTHDNKWLEGGDEFYMDHDETEWTLTQLHDNVYTLTDAAGYAVSHANGVMARAEAADAADPNQQWEFLTEENLRDEIYYATSDDPKDVTFLLKGADFGYADKDGWTTSKGNNATLDNVRGGTDNSVSCLHASNNDGSGWIFSSSSGRNWELSQSVSGLPAGTYEISYQVAAYNLGDNHGFTINGVAAPYYNLGNSDPGTSTVLTNLGNGSYMNKVIVTFDDPTNNDNTIEIKVKKEATSSVTGAYYDNFKIKCIGITGKPDMAVYDRVKVAIDDAQAKADEIGLGNHYRNNQVVALWEEQEIVGDGWNEVKRTYKNLAEAVLGISDIPADYTYAIVNNSFELYPDYNDGLHSIDGGFPFGWSYPAIFAKDSGVWPASDVNKRTDNAHGDYIFNTWPEGNEVYQEITLTPGIYTLSAMVASESGNKVYLYANDKNTAVTTVGANELVPVTLNFSVADSKPFNIGVAGAKNGSFAKQGGVWYKADNFRLTRIHSVETIKGMELLQLAINDVKTKSKKYGDKTEIDLSTYQAMLDNFTLEGDGTKEVLEVYNLLAERVFAQEGDNVDFTDVIANNSFEWNNTYGWTLTVEGGDTGVKANSNKDYKISEANGSYIFNTWTNGVGSDIYQTIPTLPAGHYELKAVFATDAGLQTFLGIMTADGDYLYRENFQRSGEKGVGEDKTLVFDIFNEMPGLKIVAGGVNGCWYKVDYFRLYRKGEQQEDNYQKNLKAAIADATEKADNTGVEIDLSLYNEMIANFSVSGSGITEIHEVYNILADAVKAQTEAGSDFTYAILNNSFEMARFGEGLYGWNYIPSSDTGVYPNSNDTYKVDSCDGEYLFNTWWQGTPLTQTISGLPAGLYTLRVQATSGDADSATPPYVYLLANDMHSDVFELPNNTSAVTELEWQFEVKEGEDLTIGIVGGTAEGTFTPDGHWWYKADNFRLTLDNTSRTVIWTMSNDTYDTLVLPFDHEVPEDLELHNVTGIEAKPVTSIVDGTETGEYYFVLSYERHEDQVIRAHTPYLVIRKSGEEPSAAKKRIVSQEAGSTYTFTGLPKNGEPAGEHLLGSHETTDAPEGSYLISVNNNGNAVFVPAEGNTLEAAHAALASPALAAVPAGRSIYLNDEDVPDDEKTSGVTSAIYDDNTMVVVFTAAGVKVAEGMWSEVRPALENGLYIVIKGETAVKTIVK